jgi:8-oxo-dGTP pyrophosphatase MutT (NUDIX family)
MGLEQSTESANAFHTEVAIAILYRDGKFLMQLRDDYPNIMYPGHWGFFGGHLEPGESPEMGVRRELLEEIGYCPPLLTLFSRRDNLHPTRPGYFTRHVYYGKLDVELHDLTLGEGLDLALLTPEDIHRGDRYSTQIQQVRPLGPPHQQILLDFMESREGIGIWGLEIGDQGSGIGDRIG